MKMYHSGLAKKFVWVFPVTYYKKKKEKKNLNELFAQPNTSFPSHSIYINTCHQYKLFHYTLMSWDEIWLTISTFP